ERAERVIGFNRIVQRGDQDGGAVDNDVVAAADRFPQGQTRRLVLAGGSAGPRQGDEPRAPGAGELDQGQPALAAERGGPRPRGPPAGRTAAPVGAGLPVDRLHRAAPHGPPRGLPSEGPRPGRRKPPRGGSATRAEFARSSVPGRATARRAPRPPRPPASG